MMKVKLPLCQGYIPLRFIDGCRGKTPCILKFGEISPSIYWKWTWMGPKASLAVVAKRKSPSSAQNETFHDNLFCQTALTLTECFLSIQLKYNVYLLMYAW